MKKRFLAFVLSFCMTVSLGTAFVYADEKENEEAAEEKAETAAEGSEFTGVWQCVAIDMLGEGEYMDSDEFEKYMGIALTDYITISFWESGNAVMTMNDPYTDEEEGQESVYRWEENKDGITLYYGEDSMTASLNDDGLLEIVSVEEYESESDGETETLENRTAMLFERAGDADETSIYAVNFCFSVDETKEMSAYMAGGIYIVEDDTVYGYYNGPKLAAAELKNDGDELEKVSEKVLLEDAACKTICKEGDVLYYIKDGSGIYSYDLKTDKESELIKGTFDYLNVTGKYIFYTDGDYKIFRADLDGKNAAQVCDDEAYYVYALGSNYVIYQDDADNETIVLYNIAEKEKTALTPEHALNPVFADGYLYYTVRDGDEFVLGRTDMGTGDMEKSDYKLTYAGFYIYDGTIYFNDGFTLTADKFDDMSANVPAAYVSTGFLWIDDNYRIEEGFGAYNVYSTKGGDDYIAMMTDEDWEEIADE